MTITGVFAGAVLFLIGYGRVQTLPLAVFSIAVAFSAVLLRGHGHAHSAFLSIDAYAQRSLLGGRSSGLKTIFAVGCTVLCVAADSMVLSIFFIVSMLWITVGLGRIPPGYYFRLLTVPAAFIFIGAIAIVAEIGTVPSGILSAPIFGYYLTVTPDRQLQALSVVMRAFGAVSCLYMLSLSTPMHRIVDVLRRAHIPAVVVELMYLIYRYIFVMQETYGNMHIAAGARFGYRSCRITLRTSMQNARNLLFLSFRQASDRFAAMESRCYDGEIRFLNTITPVAKGELVFVALYLALAAAVWLAGSLL